MFIQVKEEVEITAEAFWKPFPETLSYEASVPLTYISKWYKIESLKKETYSCNEKIKEDCEIPNKLHRVVEAFDEEFRSLMHG